MSGAIGELRLAAIDVKPGAALESQSGLQMLRPRIWGAWREPAARGRVAAIVMHPASNFMGHYLIAPLAARGVACMGLNSRYAGNDTLLLMERVIQDLGAGVAFLRAHGFAKVLLVGNSGGAALAAFYQAQASTSPSRHRARRSGPPGAGRTCRRWTAWRCAPRTRAARARCALDRPAVTDENDPLASTPRSTCRPANGAPPYATSSCSVSTRRKASDSRASSAGWTTPGPAARR